MDSKKLKSAKIRYEITKNEMYAVFWAIKKFEYELRGRRLILATDHKELEEIKRKWQFNNSRVNRWADLIQEFDFEIQYKKGVELVVPDVLSRLYEGGDANDSNDSSIKKSNLEKY